MTRENLVEALYDYMNITATIGISFWQAWTSQGDMRWPDAAEWDDPSTWGDARSSDNWQTTVAVHPGAPKVRTLLRTYPNPFNPTATIEFDVPEPGRVRLVIYDLRGRIVRTLIDTPRESGVWRLVWDGTDDHQRRVATGLYICHLEVAGRSETSKMLMLE